MSGALPALFFVSSRFDLGVLVEQAVDRFRDCFAGDAPGHRTGDRPSGDPRGPGHSPDHSTDCAPAGSSESSTSKTFLLWT